ncbi:L,D-transpeptidase family protein [Streptomyces sp. Li-HN-5-11]|uniref:L,D-transpeptidase family protein n=1 Tax=Streptomyces sp. Li-HN-5-11 TaxID=3075432 RepID=UPI0028A95552|nr:L,D-transpeptidase family protein [Streptomyces sp. Li-HN-5-11]WNM33368.1 L,D-transpeptidase family protein [Streptomyces sp. Li-HN-5-11]
MQNGGGRRATVAAAACGFFMTVLAACGGPRTEVHHGDVPRPGGPSGTARPSPSVAPPGVPGVGERLWRQVPAGTRQLVAVYGEHRDSPDSTLVLYEKRGSRWERTVSWAAHNGKQGWTTDHHEGDERSPVGVFTLSDAGGLLDDPGSRLPYTQDEDAFASPYYWDEAHWHDFDYVIAIDYNRRRGTRPDDPTRPLGQTKGGGIWLHLDHGDGTLGCVSVPEEAMEYLLRTLDPKDRPVVVMGDRVALSA